FLLDNNINVKTYRTCEQFYINGKTRYTDFVIEFLDGRIVLVETKPISRIEEFAEQIQDNIKYSRIQGWDFDLWTEKDLGFKNDYEATKWADEYLSSLDGIDYVALRKERNSEKTKKYYNTTIKPDTLDVDCEYCGVTHFGVLRKTYEENVKKHGFYVC